jgi:hypothetical protein
MSQYDSKWKTPEWIRILSSIKFYVGTKRWDKGIYLFSSVKIYDSI